MAAFKKFFDDVGSGGQDPNWVGTVWRCKLTKLGEGGQAVPCGAQVLGKRSNTTGLHNHMRDHHPVEYRQTVTAAKDITSFFPGAKDDVQRRRIALAFSENALPYQVALLVFFFD